MTIIFIVSLVLWVGDSDRAQHLSSQLEDLKTGGWNPLKAHPLSHGLCWTCQLEHLHLAFPQGLHFSAARCMGSKAQPGSKSQHRPDHHDASRKVTSTIKSRVSEWEKKRNGNKGDQGEPCLSNTASENQKRQKYNLLPLSYLCIV